MVRRILGVVVGYLVSAVWVVVTLSASWMLLGAGFAFTGEGTRTSLGWALLMLVLGLVGAVLGGWVAAAIGRSRRTAVWLAGLMLVLGLVLAVFNLASDRASDVTALAAGRTPSEFSMAEAASLAIPPAWYDWAIALAGMAGALFGGRLWERRHSGA